MGDKTFEGFMINVVIDIIMLVTFRKPEPAETEHETKVHHEPRPQVIRPVIPPAQPSKQKVAAPPKRPVTHTVTQPTPSTSDDATRSRNGQYRKDVLENPRVQGHAVNLVDKLRAQARVCVYRNIYTEIMS